MDRADRRSVDEDWPCPSSHRRARRRTSAVQPERTERATMKVTCPIASRSASCSATNASRSPCSSRAVTCRVISVISRASASDQVESPSRHDALEWTRPVEIGRPLDRDVDGNEPSSDNEPFGCRNLLDDCQGCVPAAELLRGLRNERVVPVALRQLALRTRVDDEDTAGTQRAGVPGEHTLVLGPACALLVPDVVQHLIGHHRVERRSRRTEGPAVGPRGSRIVAPTRASDEPPRACLHWHRAT